MGFYNAVTNGNDGYGSAKEQSFGNLNNMFSSGSNLVKSLCRWFNIGGGN